jgi:oxygen-independent coproporphyrinogen-3 oxidase
MAGIYLHIPFCRKACHYCDFHFSTTLKGREEIIAAMHKELADRQGYLQGEKISTVYFGGGTPSLLSETELNGFIDEIAETFELSSDAEITLEANPDDLTREKIRELTQSPVNRLSIGVQSFREEDLKWMNRAHTASQSDYAIKLAQDAGFENITIDLIYSIPGMSKEQWGENLGKAISLEVNHISAYSLTIEPKTVFGHLHKKGQLKMTEQEVSEQHFLLMTEMLGAAGFEHYEVSNFARQGWRSRHNTAYWEGKKYLGVGPSAHSFDGSSRQWNVSNNALYERAVRNGTPYFEREELSDSMRLNEYIMTGMRTSAGIDLRFIRHRFGIDLMKRYEQIISTYILGGAMKLKDETLRLTTTGFLLADRIASDLFIIEE